MKSQELAAAISYMVDLAPNAVFLHSWRVALVAGKIAEQIAPSVKNDTFYAGLFHDIGHVGSSDISDGFIVPSQSIINLTVKDHPIRGSAMLDTIPGTKEIAHFIRTHHEWLDGSGYPNGLSGRQIPFGAQILSLVDSVALTGCFERGNKISDCLKTLVPFTGTAWSTELWSAFIQSLHDTAFYKSVLNDNTIGNVMSTSLEEYEPPKEMVTGKGIESLFHLIASLVDIKDHSTRGHSMRVAKLAKALSASLGMDEDDVELAYHAGLVHDCGRLGIPEQILDTPGRLSEKDMNMVRKHANITIKIFNCLPENESLISLGNVAGHDHERYDGKGYPHHLVAKDIPKISRIISVADAYDSMVSSGSYRLLSHRGAIVRLQQDSGKQFDSEIVEVFAKLFEQNQSDSEAA